VADVGQRSVSSVLPLLPHVLRLVVHVQPRYDSDPYPFDQATDFARTEAKNWTMGDRWNSHFVQGTCESDLALRSVCASLFACFVYFDMVETLHMIEWLYWVQRGTADMRTSWFFPDSLKVRVRPSPFDKSITGGTADRELETRVPILFRCFVGALRGGAEDADLVLSPLLRRQACRSPYFALMTTLR
jgi:hypothetical protein